MSAPEGVVVTIPTDTLANRLAWFQNEGRPVEPEGYADMAADDPIKVGYDESLAMNTTQCAEIQAKIDAGES